MKGPQIKIKASGTKMLQKNLEALRPKVLQTGKASVKIAGKGVYDQALFDTPRDTGALANSMFRDTEATETNVTCIVGHGGEYKQYNPVTGLSTDYYAAERHEFMGGAFTNKWLEIALVAQEGEFNQVLKDNFGKLFATGEATVDDLPDKENRIGDLNIEGSRAYAYKQRMQGNLATSGAD